MNRNGNRARLALVLPLVTLAAAAAWHVWPLVARIAG